VSQKQDTPCRSRALACLHRKGCGQAAPCVWLQALLVALLPPPPPPPRPCLPIPRHAEREAGPVTQPAAIPPAWCHQFHSSSLPPSMASPSPSPTLLHPLQPSSSLPSCTNLPESPSRLGLKPPPLLSLHPLPLPRDHKPPPLTSTPPSHAPSPNAPPCPHPLAQGPLLDVNPPPSYPGPPHLHPVPLSE